jgi:hypothetical protein
MKPRARIYDPFASATAWTPRPAKPTFEHTAANSTFLATQQGPLTQVNVGPTPSRAAQLNAAERSPLEARYPAIAMAITHLWGYPEMNDYFSKLWLSDGNAEPIDPEAMADLMLLARIHQHLAPSRPQRTLASMLGTDESRFHDDDRWSMNRRRR